MSSRSMKDDVEVNGSPMEAAKDSEKVQVDEVIMPETSASHQLGMSEVRRFTITCYASLHITDHSPLT